MQIFFELENIEIQIHMYKKIELRKNLHFLHLLHCLFKKGLIYMTTPELPYFKVYSFLSRKKRRGGTVTIAYGENHYLPWQATFAGSGHYWHSLEAALAYCCGRGFLPEAEVEDTAKTIRELMKEAGFTDQVDNG